MTIVTAAVSSGPYIAAGQTTFDVEFQSDDDDGIEVTLDGDIIDPSAYTFNREADGTGVVITDAPVTGSVLIVSKPSFQQRIEFQRFGPWFPDQINPGLDKAAVRDLYLKNEIEQTSARVEAFIDGTAEPTLRADLLLSTGSNIIGFVSSAAGAVLRTVRSKLRDVLNVMDFGAIGDGATNDRAALVLADAAGPIVISSNHRVSSDLTITNPITFVGNGRLTVDAGVTVTLRGEVKAPDQRLFYGSGSVVGIRDVCPEWFGAVRDGVTDDITALNKAHTCVMASKTSRGGRQRIRLLGGTYGVSSTWVVTPTADVGLLIEGTGTVLGGSRLTDIAAFTSTTTPVLQVDGQTDAIQKIADWGLKGFGVIAGPGLATQGIFIGSTNSAKTLIGVKWQEIEDVYVENFANNWKLCHVRMLSFKRVSSWSSEYVGACVPLLITVNGAFTADINFDDDCQFVSNAAATVGSRCVQITCSSGDYNNSTGANSIAGIQFGNVDFYAAERAIDIYCSNGGYVSDIWFQNSQFDQQSSTAVYITSDKTSGTTPGVENINLNGVYFSGNIAQTIAMVSAGTGGIIRSVNISNCQSKGGQTYFLNCFGPGIKSVVVSDNRIINNNNHGGGTGSVINLGTTDGAVVRGNILSRTDGTSFPDIMVAIASGANNYSVRGNVAGGLAGTAIVSDAGGAVTKSVGDNI